MLLPNLLQASWEAYTPSQHLMMIVTICWCFRLLQRCVMTSLALLAALTIGATAPTLALPQGVMSENATVLGMAGALYFAVRYRDRASQDCCLIATTMQR
jgi:hypothetical protein